MQYPSDVSIVPLEHIMAWNQKSNEVAWYLEQCDTMYCARFADLYSPALAIPL